MIPLMTDQLKSQRAERRSRAYSQSQLWYKSKWKKSWVSSRLQLSSLPVVKCESPAVAPPRASLPTHNSTTGDGVALFALGGALLLLALLIVSCILRTCRRIGRSKPSPPPRKGESNPAAAEWNNEGSEQGNSPSSEKGRDPFGA